MSFVSNPGYLVFDAQPREPTPLEKSQALVKKYEDAFAGFQKEPLAIFTIVAITGEGRGVIVGSPPVEINVPPGRTSEYVRLRDLVSGAMIEGIVQKAAGLAIKRDRERGFVSPLQLEDVEQAIKITLRQQASENHDAVIRDLSKSFGKLPEKVRKVIDG